MATRSTDPLTKVEQDKVLLLDPLMQQISLLHRQRVLERGVPFAFTSTTRSPEQQEALHKADPTLAVPAGRSKHEIGFAYDANGPRTSDEWDVFGAEAEKLGLKWGGRFRTREPWHVELANTRAELQTYRALKLLGIALVIGIGGAILVKTTGGKK